MNILEHLEKLIDLTGLSVIKETSGKKLVDHGQRLKRPIDLYKSKSEEIATGIKEIL